MKPAARATQQVGGSIPSSTPHCLWDKPCSRTVHASVGLSMVVEQTVVLPVFPLSPIIFLTPSTEQQPSSFLKIETDYLISFTYAMSEKWEVKGFAILVQPLQFHTSSLHVICATQCFVSETNSYFR